MKKNGRTLREDTSIILRGMKEFEKILPCQLKYVAIRSLLISCIPYISVIMTSYILNELAGNQNQSNLLIYIGISIGATLFFTVIKNYLDAKIAVGYSRLFPTHEIVLTDKAYNIPYALLEEEQVRSLREQVSGSINVSGAGMASLYWDIEVVITNLCSAITGAILMAHFISEVIAGNAIVKLGHMEVVGVILLLVGLVMACSYVSCKMTSKRFDVSFDVFEKGAKYMRYGEFYTLNYLPDEDMALDIRVFHQKKLILDESQQKCYKYFAKEKADEMNAVNKYDGVKLFCTSLCGMAVYGLVGYYALHKVVSIGDIMVIYAAVTMLILALSELAQIITDLRNNNVHLLNYFQYMDMPEESLAQPIDHTNKDIKRNSSRKMNGANQMNEIRFENVSFHYPESETLVLQNINLRISGGEKLAIVGENGSGKTTLIKLLCRLYKPTSGNIYMNGKDIWEYPYDDYIESIASVFQDFSLFGFSIAENVAASLDYNEEGVQAALEQAGLKQKVEKLPKGIMQTLFHGFEEDGVNLSGGEAQKLAIARAIYKEAPIMILDEPTAALDPYAEAEIYEQFFGNLAKKFATTSQQTVLSISHRLSSCRLCDRIAVLDEGHLVQIGSHEALVAHKEGKYYHLWQMQAQYYA